MEAAWNYETLVSYHDTTRWVSQPRRPPLEIKTRQVKSCKWEALDMNHHHRESLKPTTFWGIFWKESDAYGNDVQIQCRANPTFPIVVK
jgi:hypothetical protein